MGFNFTMFEERRTYIVFCFVSVIKKSAPFQEWVVLTYCNLFNYFLIIIILLGVHVIKPQDMQKRKD